MNNIGYSTILVHPGELIKEELQARNLTQKYFSRVTGIPYTLFNDVLNGRRPVSTELALTIEAAMGISAEMLVNIQTRYNMQLARRDEGKAKHLRELQKICASLF